MKRIELYKQLKQDLEKIAKDAEDYLKVVKKGQDVESMCIADDLDKIIINANAAILMINSILEHYKEWSKEAK